MTIPQVEIERVRWEIEYHQQQLNEATTQNRVDAVHRHKVLLQFWREQEQDLKKLEKAQLS